MLTGQWRHDYFMSCFDQWLLAGGHISPLKGIKVWKLELETKVDPKARNHGEGHGPL